MRRGSGASLDDPPTPPIRHESESRTCRNRTTRTKSGESSGIGGDGLTVVDHHPGESEVLHPVVVHRLRGRADLAVVAGVGAALADRAPGLPAEERLETIALWIMRRRQGAAVSFLSPALLRPKQCVVEPTAAAATTTTTTSGSSVRGQGGARESSRCHAARIPEFPTRWQRAGSLGRTLLYALAVAQIAKMNTWRSIVGGDSGKFVTDRGGLLSSSCFKKAKA